MLRQYTMKVTKPIDLFCPNDRAAHDTAECSIFNILSVKWIAENKVQLYTMLKNRITAEYRRDFPGSSEQWKKDIVDEILDSLDVDYIVYTFDMQDSEENSNDEETETLSVKF